MKTIVNVDGFNLYYGALRPTPQTTRRTSMARPGRAVHTASSERRGRGIKYFTALVASAPWESGQPKQSVSQRTYLRALMTVPDLTIHYGHFLSHPVKRRLITPPRQGSAFREVWHTEEKGSDVNLASHVLIDGFRGRYDLAVVISNDGDLKEPVHFVRHDLNLAVGVLNPHPKRSWALSPSNLPSRSFYKPIRQGAVKSSQFPATLTDTSGRFSKPPGW